MNRVSPFNLSTPHAQAQAGTMPKLKYAGLTKYFDLHLAEESISPPPQHCTPNTISPSIPMSNTIFASPHLHTPHPSSSTAVTPSHSQGEGNSHPHPLRRKQPSAHSCMHVSFRCPSPSPRSLSKKIRGMSWMYLIAHIIWPGGGSPRLYPPS